MVYIVTSLSANHEYETISTQIHGVFYSLTAANDCARKAWAEKYSPSLQADQPNSDAVCPSRLPYESVAQELRKGMDPHSGSEASFEYYKDPDGGVNITYMV